jgi:hypothetical protein
MMSVSGIHVSHFGAMLIFALLVSVAFACAGRHSLATRVRYALWSLLLFLLIGIGIAWLMYPLSR